MIPSTPSLRGHLRSNPALFAAVLFSCAALHAAGTLTDDNRNSTAASSSSSSSSSSSYSPPPAPSSPPPAPSSPTPSFSGGSSSNYNTSSGSSYNSGSSNAESLAPRYHLPNPSDFRPTAPSNPANNNPPNYNPGNNNPTPPNYPSDNHWNHNGNWGNHGNNGYNADYYYNDYYRYGMYGRWAYENYGMFWNPVYNYDSISEIPHFFFPPTTPILGSPIPNSVDSHLLTFTPKGLEAYVGESFYSQLASRLQDGNLSKAQQQQLSQYTQTRDAELAKLRAKIAACAKLPAAERDQALAEFAQQQSSVLQGLERDAETIRKGLIRHGLIAFLGRSYDWESERGWSYSKSQLSQAYDKKVALAASLARGASFYQDELDPRQRGLLQEAFVQLNIKKKDDDAKLLFFAPETACVRLPVQMAPDLQQKIDVYRQQKRELTKDLTDKLLSLDHFGPQRRTEAIKAFREEQRPKLDALEMLADDIRHQVYSDPKFFATGYISLLPLSLYQQTLACIKEGNLMKQSLDAQIREMQQIATKAKVSLIDGDALEKNERNHLLFKVSIAPASAVDDDNLARLRESMGRFNKANQVLANDLVRHVDALNRDLAEYISNTPALKGKTPDDVVRDLRGSSLNPLDLEHYRDYYHAAFLPGLSSEQRRLLLHGALVDMKLLLPPAE